MQGTTLAEFGIPEPLWKPIRASWAQRHCDFIGRFDFLWDGEGEPMLAEYNADTPTVMIESAAAQRDWYLEKHPTKGQFNVLEEALEAGWYSFGKQLLARCAETYGPYAGRNAARPGCVFSITAEGLRDYAQFETNALCDLRDFLDSFDFSKKLSSSAFLLWCAFSDHIYGK